jgi:nicotinic acid mononucleotide adenylyltransferase
MFSEPDIQQKISAINTSNKRFYVTVAGGGCHFFPGYLNNFGASKVFMGGRVVYKQAGFDKFVGGKIDQYVSAFATRKLALASLREAIEESGEPENAVGIAVSCATVKLNERADRKHHFYIAVQTYNESRVAHVDMTDNNDWDRDEQDMCAGLQILNVMYDMTLENTEIRWDDYRAGDILSIVDSEDVWHDLPDCTAPKLVVYSGSFNPMHEGHLGIIKRAEEILGVRPVVEISVHSVGKPPLDHIDVYTRLEQFQKANVNSIISDCPLYSGKIAVFEKFFDFEELVFCIGYDTYERIFSMDHYKDEETYENFIRQLQTSKTKFLLFGRGGQNKVNEEHKHFIIEDGRALNYRVDVSSTELRKKSN